MRDGPQTDEEAIALEERWSRGSAVGEAVWLRLCRSAGWDPKDPALSQQRGAIVGTVRDACSAMEGEGLEGLSEWLDMEGWAEMGNATIPQRPAREG